MAGGRTEFTYTVLARPDDRVVGCVYIYPPKSADGGQSAGPGSPEAPGGAPGEGGTGGAAGVADVRSWVRADRAELDVPLYLAVKAWLAEAWPFSTVRYAARPAAGGTAPAAEP